MDEFNLWIIGGGFFIGAIFAIMVQRFRFCLVGGISSLLLIKDHRQILAFSAALLVAISGTQLLEIMDIVAIEDSGYRNNTLDWFGATVGGFVFGIGATFAGGCAARTIVRTAEGSLHSLIVLISFCLVAAITQFGFFETSRVSLTQITAIELNTDAGIASILSLPQWFILAIVIFGLSIFIFKSWKQCTDKSMLIVGIVIGLLVVLSWLITGLFSQDEFDPIAPSAMTISGPLARFGYILMSGRLPAFSFAVSFVISTAIVSFILALTSNQFKITAPAKGMVKMAIFGGSLMGLGAIMAYGCNIGQGLSGISTLSLESVLAVFGMILGISVVTRWMENQP